MSKERLKIPLQMLRHELTSTAGFWVQQMRHGGVASELGYLWGSCNGQKTIMWQCYNTLHLQDTSVRLYLPKSFPWILLTMYQCIKTIFIFKTQLYDVPKLPKLPAGSFRSNFLCVLFSSISHILSLVYCYTYIRWWLHNGVEKSLIFVW